MLLFILYASPLFTKEKKKNTFASRMLSYLATSEHVSCQGLQLHQHLIRSLEKRLKMSKLTLLWGGISHQIPKKQEKLSQFWLQNSRYDSSKKKNLYMNCDIDPFQIFYFLFWSDPFQFLVQWPPKWAKAKYKQKQTYPTTWDAPKSNLQKVWPKYPKA